MENVCIDHYLLRAFQKDFGLSRFRSGLCWILSHQKLSGFFSLWMGAYEGQFDTKLKLSNYSSVSVPQTTEANLNLPILRFKMSCKTCISCMIQLGRHVRVVTAHSVFSSSLCFVTYK
jgi:hypothetical protein